jgi:16S rRNA (guanine527-N7)-methyltransferase
MQPARIAELLEPYLGPPEARRLKPEAMVYISTYIDLLKRWNARVNLTAIRNEEEIVTRHFGESLFAARHLFPFKNTVANGSVNNRGRAALKGRVIDSEKSGALAPVVAVADVGSGAGFPGIPLKLYAPEISLTLIESNHKKATFLKELTRALTLTDINIQISRAETLAQSSFNVVTLRAVERFESILPIASRLVVPDGRLALLIGSPQFAVAQTVLSDLTWSHPIAIPNSQSRIVAFATKSDST